MYEVFLPAIKAHGGGEGGQHRTALFYDLLEAHDCDEAKAFYEKHNIDRFRIHADFTWKFQTVDVALASHVKGHCAEPWFKSMREKIKNTIIHKKSKNYKVPTKADAIMWANAAWDSIFRPCHQWL